MQVSVVGLHAEVQHAEMALCCRTVSAGTPSTPGPDRKLELGRSAP
jgi:hypothetical protein